MKKIYGTIILGNHDLNYKDNCVLYFNEKYLVIDKEDTKYKIEKDNIVDVSFCKTRMQKKKQISGLNFYENERDLNNLNLISATSAYISKSISNLLHINFKNKRYTEVTIVYKDKALFENKIIIAIK